ncbi:MAG: hypothetical protein ACD_14C00031G0002 [uncultured bacterium]|nr:MAG: hypothetical protein ACD_14C00031G0002 [uncultured bacterium]KKQ44101.1 MAG: hypothetical protein US63_C0034G0003 [Candidatus Moranbacteria bacterium GW2011_GWC2_37_8]KKQ60364.1 MAG: hypothetical protein US82_C0037G0004 [Parcubacteria group bacterium GW2011_GWC1_38_22]KKQ79982.1 MAG: hypothetical protein UT03_C0036G0007 [Candidatus Moranbacteria bacterium GW2011_GWD2_38_7]
MSNKIIIASTCFFLLVSFVFLSWSERKQADINTKNIWMTYFENPRDNSLDFKIENHSTVTNFHWQILADKNIIKEENVAIALDETKTIPVSLSDINGKKIIIVVTAGTDRKEIYKTF